LTGQLEAAEEAAEVGGFTDAPQMNLPLFAKLRATPTLDTVQMLAAETAAGRWRSHWVSRRGRIRSTTSEGMTARRLRSATTTTRDPARRIASCRAQRTQRVVRVRPAATAPSCWRAITGRPRRGEATGGTGDEVARLADAAATSAPDGSRNEADAGPLLMPLPSGPFAGDAGCGVSVPAALRSNSPRPGGGRARNPLHGVLEPCGSRSRKPEEAETRTRLLDFVLAHRAGAVSHPRDATLLLYLASRLSDVPGRGSDIWAWAEPLATAFPQDAGVLNLLAWVAFRLGATAEDANPNQGLEEKLSPDNVDKLFRRSLDLDPNELAHFARAGMFYLNVNNMGEAERCLARGFASIAQAASWRCGWPRCIGRPIGRAIAHGAGHVLREGARARNGAPGGDDAGSRTVDALVTYLGARRAAAGRVWTSYYRAVGLLELQRQRRRARSSTRRQGEPPGTLHLDLLRARAAAGRDRRVSPAAGGDSGGAIDGGRLPVAKRPGATVRALVVGGELPARG
jgi:hypothetical protein